MMEGNGAGAMARKKKQTTMSDSEASGNEGKGVTRSWAQKKGKTSNIRREHGC